MIEVVLQNDGRSGSVELVFSATPVAFAQRQS
jgi:hypothetical protein